MSRWQRAVEKQILRAIEAGDFDHLPGKGKPLRLEENPFEDSEWRMAWELLKSNDFTLPWLEMRQEIEKSLEEARRQLSRAWHYRLGKISAGEAQDWIESEWAQSVDRFVEQVAELNGSIFDYNLQVPNARFSLYAVDVEEELNNLKTDPNT